MIVEETIKNNDGNYVRVVVDDGIDIESLMPEPEICLVDPKGALSVFSDAFGGNYNAFSEKEIRAFELYESGDFKKCLSEYALQGDADDLLRLIEELEGGVVRSLYMYRHGDVALSITGFDCPWDSGQVGWVVMERSKVEEEFGASTTKDPAAYSRATNLVKAQVREMGAILNGDVYGFMIYDKNPDEYVDAKVVDSCFGFIGHDLVANGLYDYANISNP